MPCYGRDFPLMSQYLVFLLVPLFVEKAQHSAILLVTSPHSAGSSEVVACLPLVLPGWQLLTMLFSSSSARWVRKLEGAEEEEEHGELH